MEEVGKDWRNKIGREWQHLERRERKNLIFFILRERNIKG